MNDWKISAPQRQVLSVAQLNGQARVLLESQFPLVWVAGEISNLGRPGSGHWYFSLKDQDAQVECAMFRQRALLLRFAPTNGMQVVARARVSLYEPRGRFQLIVEHMEEAGSGGLQRAFEQLKQKLLAEGLFEAAHKKPLPALPRRVGVITSPTGAALQDVLTVLRRRFSAIPILIYPVPVQGSAAAPAIVEAMRQANRRRDCDVLLLTRGGGSLEDLWAFNEESVARAIHASELPVVSAVGHEIDFTIADWVADARAPTPSAAAELLSPDGSRWQAQLLSLQQRMQGLLRQRLDAQRQRLQWLAGRLRHPRRRIEDALQRTDDLESRLRRAWRQSLEKSRFRLERLQLRLRYHNPQPRLQQQHSIVESLAARLRNNATQHLQIRRARLAELAHTLATVSPLATLQRGYAIISDANGKILTQAAATQPGAMVQAELAQGRLHCRVESIAKQG